MSYKYDENSDSFPIRRGATVFLLTFVISVVSGSILNRMLAGPRLKSIIAKKLEIAAPEIEFDLGYAKVLLSDGGFPMVGLSVDKLTVRKVAECGKRLHLKLEGLVIPFHFLDLLNGKVRVGDIDVKKLVVFEVPEVVQRCEQEVKSSDQIDTTARPPIQSHTSVHMTEPTERFPLDSITISDITLLNKGGDPSIFFRGLTARQTDAGLEFEAGILPAVETTNSSPLRLNVEIFDHYDKAKLGLRWREGRAEGFLQSLKSRDINGELTLNKMPMSEMYKMARRLGLVQDERDMGANWLDTSLNWNGLAQKIDIKNVVVSGDIGKVTAAGFSIEYAHKVTVTPFRASLEPLRTDEILRVLKVDEIQRLFVTAGEILGAFEYTGREMLLKGELVKTTALFSREGRRASLRIGKANLEVDYRVGSDLHGRISNIEIEKGHWVGGVSWHHRFLDSSTDFELKFDQLMVPPQLTETLFGLRLGNIKSSVSIALDHGKVRDLQMQTQIESAEGRNFSATKSSLNASYKDKKAEGRLRLDRLSLASGLTQFADLGDGSDAETVFQKFEGKVDLEEDVLTLGPIDFKGPVSSGELKGVWSLGSFDGAITLRRVGSEKVFLLRGPLETLTLRAQ